MDEAIAQYRKALELRPDYPQAHNNLAGMLLQRGSAAEALQHYQEAVRLNPRYVDAFQNMARAYAAAGQFDEAVRSVQAALALSPPEPVASTLRDQLRAYSSRQRRIVRGVRLQADIQVRLKPTPRTVLIRSITGAYRPPQLFGTCTRPQAWY